jgi:hypothetical protein
MAPHFRFNAGQKEAPIEKHRSSITPTAGGPQDWFIGTV